MTDFNIEWHEAQRPGFAPFLYANALGHYLKVFQIPPRGSETVTRYGATHDEAGEEWAIGSREGYASEDEAKTAVATWLAKQVRELRGDGAGEIHPGPAFALTAGLSYGLKFLEAVRPHLTDWDAVEVVPCNTADGHNGLYLRSYATGQGIHIQSCSRTNYVAMSTGEISELDDFDANKDRISTTYFHESEIAAYAKSSGTSYLSSERSTAARTCHSAGGENYPKRSDMRLLEVLTAPPASTGASSAPGDAVLDLLVLLSNLVEGEVGRHTLNTLARGQGTETEDGKNWLAAAATVKRLKAEL